jgi:lysophospholipase L1-like esterase
VPKGAKDGTQLDGPKLIFAPMKHRQCNAFNSLDPASLVIAAEKGGKPLVSGKDYVLNPPWAALGIGPKSAVSPTSTVYASYRYGLLRLDAVDIGADGKVVLRRGEPDLSIPKPPEPAPDSLRLAHVFRPYRATNVEPAQIYPVRESAAQARTLTTPGRIPKTLAKLKAGGPVIIACMGDSITEGASASTKEKGYVDVFAAGLRARFPKAEIKVVQLGVGATSCFQWLTPKPPADFKRVAEVKPDLVTVEFINDRKRTADQARQAYGDLLRRISALSAECILVTPPFTAPQLMGFKSQPPQENNAYVFVLRELARNSKVALADVSGRFEHLYLEGIPYITLLQNTTNHPDDRGHLMIAEEILKCFGDENPAPAKAAD